MKNKILKDVIKISELLSPIYNVNCEVDKHTHSINVTGYSSIDPENVVKFFDALEDYFKKIYPNMETENDL